MQDFKSVYLLRDVDLEVCILKKGSIVDMCDTGLKTFFKTDNLEIAVENSKLKQYVGETPYYINKEELDKSANLGSVLKILTDLGIQGYTIEEKHLSNGASEKRVNFEIPLL